MSEKLEFHQWNKKEIKGLGATSDEYYTPRYAVKPLLKYLKPTSNIWCPFDTDESEFVKVLRDDGKHAVYNTHIKTGDDFFKTEVPDDTQYIISNPPFSMKNEVFERLYEIGLPFAILIVVNGLFESEERFTMFRENAVELMFFSGRINYFQTVFKTKIFTSPPFSSVFACSKLLPKQIVFEDVNKKDC
jgi:hypothetical protein